uniref:Uncharacterized protein n=1 Tax=Anguilla anguilla TaxID=7936 RepID=A0A0E9WEU3_ANGAN
MSRHPQSGNNLRLNTPPIMKLCNGIRQNTVTINGQFLQNANHIYFSVKIIGHTLRGLSMWTLDIQHLIQNYWH